MLAFCSRHSPVWSTPEQLDLLSLWGEKAVQLQLRSSRRNHDIYGLIASGMQEKGLERDTQQCRAKIKELRQAHQKAREANRCSEPCGYFGGTGYFGASELNPSDEVVDEEVELEDDVKQRAGSSGGAACEDPFSTPEGSSQSQHAGSGMQERGAPPAAGTAPFYSQQQQRPSREHSVEQQGSHLLPRAQAGTLRGSILLDNEASRVEKGSCVTSASVLGALESTWSSSLKGRHVGGPLLERLLESFALRYQASDLSVPRTALEYEECPLKIPSRGYMFTKIQQLVHGPDPDQMEVNRNLSTNFSGHWTEPHTKNTFIDRVCQQPGLSLWVPFQNAATAVTNLYKESVDAHQRSFDVGIQIGYQRRNKDVLAWVKKRRRTIRREDLISFLCGKVPPPRNSRAPPRLTVVSPNRATSTETSSSVETDLQPFREAIALHGLSGAMASISVRSSTPGSPTHVSSGSNASRRRNGLHDVDLNTFISEEMALHLDNGGTRKRTSAQCGDVITDSPTHKRNRMI
ncbi:UPF0472 protein C16orf72 [Chelonia mydas]|uniref:UPF0472 protein C16orf72 n=9 Tax=Archelosauria TaxID=1329799 RepID=M7BW63_CHEMY|nr:UPF0472 protein C16orf72 [Chelonia mydas]